MVEPPDTFGCLTEQEASIKSADQQIGGSEVFEWRSVTAHPPRPRQLAWVHRREELGENDMQLGGVRAKAREVRQGDVAAGRCCSRPLLGMLRPFRCSFGRAPTASLLQSFGTLLVLEFYTRACSGRKFAFAAC